MIPIHEIVRPNAVLEAAGLLKPVSDGGRLRIAPDTPMVAVASAAAINLYLNLAGREPGGVVSAPEAPELLRRAARAFADLEVEGRPVTEKIFTRAEAAAVGLGSPSSGDLVVFLAPGFTAEGGPYGPDHEPSRYYGQHGYLASHDEMCGMLFARGAGIKKKRGGEVPAIEVAPMVARWLGFDLARTSHQLPAAAGDAPHPTGFSHFGVLDVLSSTTPRPSGRKHHWARHLADLATKVGEKCGLVRPGAGAE